MNFLKSAKDFIVKKWKESNKKAIAFTLFMFPMLTAMFLTTSVMSFWQAFIASYFFIITAEFLVMIALQFLNRVDKEQLQKYDTAQAGAIGLVYEGSHMQKFVNANANKNVHVGSVAANKFVKKMKNEQVKNYKNIDEDTKKALNELFNKEDSSVMQEEISYKNNIEEFSKVFHNKK